MTCSIDTPAGAQPTLEQDAAELQRALDEATDRNPGMLLLPLRSALSHVLQAVRVNLSAQALSPGRRMKAPPDDGPIKGEAIAQRAMKICGCQGQYDCRCVSCLNQASRELWTEHNQAERAAKEACRDLPACPASCASKGTSACSGRCS